MQTVLYTGCCKSGKVSRKGRESESYSEYLLFWDFWKFVKNNQVTSSKKLIYLTKKVFFYFLTTPIFPTAPLGRDRHLELIPQRAPGHQGHSVAGRPAHAATGGAGEVPHEDHVPGGASVHQPGASRPGQRPLLARSGGYLQSRAWSWSRWVRMFSAWYLCTYCGWLLAF